VGGWVWVVSVHVSYLAHQGKPDRVHMHNVEYLHAHDWHQSSMRLAEPQATDLKTKVYASQAG